MTGGKGLGWLCHTNQDDVILFALQKGAPLSTAQLVLLADSIDQVDQAPCDLPPSTLAVPSLLDILFKMEAQLPGGLPSDTQSVLTAARVVSSERQTGPILDTRPAGENIMHVHESTSAQAFLPGQGQIRGCQVVGPAAARAEGHIEGPPHLPVLANSNVQLWFVSISCPLAAWHNSNISLVSLCWCMF